MQVEGERSGVFESSNWARGNKDGRREGERCFGLTNTKVCQGCSKVLRISKLLLPIYLRLCIYSKTITQHSEEGSEVEMNRKAGRGIQRAKRKVHKGTSVGSTKSGLKK